MDDLIVWPTPGHPLGPRVSLVENPCAVLTSLRNVGLRAQLRKCWFFEPKVDFLGHILSADGVTTDPATLRGILDFPVPHLQKVGNGAPFLKYQDLCVPEKFENLSSGKLDFTRIFRQGHPARSLGESWVLPGPWIFVSA
jgi:hypothetical protein